MLMKPEELDGRACLPGLSRRPVALAPVGAVALGTRIGIGLRPGAGTRSRRRGAATGPCCRRRGGPFIGQPPGDCRASKSCAMARYVFHAWSLHSPVRKSSKLLVFTSFFDFYPAVTW